MSSRETLGLFLYMVGPHNLLGRLKIDLRGPWRLLAANSTMSYLVC